MNTKFNFVADQNIDPVEIVTKQQSEYSEIVQNLDIHYKLHNELKSKWNYNLNFPEYEYVFEDNEHKIKSTSSKISLVTLQDKDLAENIILLMNLSFREGAKQIIQILEHL